jgi:hypothetical protein
MAAHRRVELGGFSPGPPVDVAGEPDSAIFSRLDESRIK